MSRAKPLSGRNRSSNLDRFWKLRAKLRALTNVRWCSKMELNVSVLFANPNFRCPCFEIQRDFLLDLLQGVRGRENFNADFRSSRKTYQGTHLPPTFWHHPRNVGSFYAVRGGNRAIGDRSPLE